MAGVSTSQGARPAAAGQERRHKAQGTQLAWHTMVQEAQCQHAADMT